MAEFQRTGYKTLAREMGAVGRVRFPIGKCLAAVTGQGASIPEDQLIIVA